MNIVILQGTLSRPPTRRELPSGDHLAAFEVITQPSDGPAESVPVIWVDAPDRALDLEAGTEVVVTGRVRRRYFRAAGATASRTEVAADTVVPASQRYQAAQAVAAAAMDFTRPGRTSDGVRIELGADASWGTVLHSLTDSMFVADLALTTGELYVVRLCGVGRDDSGRETLAFRHFDADDDAPVAEIEEVRIEDVDVITVY